jgi:drug/metabolite transporter (DMT)-like permease
MRQPTVYARVIVAVVAVSFGAILVRMATDAPPLSVAAWRLCLAAAILVPAAWIHGTLRTLERRTLLLSLCSGLALAMHFVLWITSLRYTSVASSVLFVSTHPIFVGLGSFLFLKERPDRRLALGIAAAVLGASLIGLDDLRFGASSATGDLLALGGGVMAAVYFLIGRNVRRTVHWIDYVAVTYATAGIAVLAACLAFRQPLIGFRQETYFYLALLAAGPQLLGHGTFNWALKHLPASRVSLMILGEPVGSTLLAYLFFGEALNWSKGAGAVIILLGIYATLHREEASSEPSKRTRED